MNLTKTSFLLFSFFILLTSCKKDDEKLPSEINVAYNIGDQFTYLENYYVTKDNINTAGIDSVIASLNDTVVLTVEKDTIINGINCRVLYYFSKEARGYMSSTRYKSYIEQKSDGIYEVARLDYHDGELGIYPNPRLIIEKPLRVGKHSGELLENGKYETMITNISTISTSAGSFICAEIFHYDHPEDFLYHKDNKRVAYFSDQGIILTKFEFYNEYTKDSIDWKNSFFYVSTRIK